MTTAAAPTWEQVLDHLDERLRRQRAVVDGASTELPAGGLPIVSGRCPAHLEGRLRALLDETRALEARAQERLAAMRAQRAPARSSAVAYGASMESARRQSAQL